MNPSEILCDKPKLMSWKPKFLYYTSMISFVSVFVLFCLTSPFLSFLYNQAVIFVYRTCFCSVVYSVSETCNHNLMLSPG